VPKALTLVLLAALAACSTGPVTGPPNRTATSARTTTAPTSGLPTSGAPTSGASPDAVMRVGTPRSLVDVESCELLTEDDFTGVGLFAHPPKVHYYPLNACAFRIGNGSDDDVGVVVGFDEAFTEMKSRNGPHAYGVDAEGNSTLTGCDPGPNAPDELECQKVVAVTEDLTLAVVVSKRGGTAERLTPLVEALVTAVLARLPVG
jgi:hypothetical protein